MRHMADGLHENKRPRISIKRVSAPRGRRDRIGTRNGAEQTGRDEMTSQLMKNAILVAALGSGLVGGVLFAFSTFVMSALARLPAPQGIAAIQSINIVAINPMFMGAFLGTGAICVGLMIGAVSRWHDPATPYILTGGLLYVLGTILVTMIWNVPMNDALAAVDPNTAEAAHLWGRVVQQWTAWNHVRTVAALAAAVALMLADRNPLLWAVRA